MANKKNKLPPNKAERLVLRFVVPDSSRGVAVVATETPVLRFDKSRGYVVREVLLMEGCRFRGGRNQIPIVDSHDDTTVRNIFGSIQGLKIDRSTGELYGNPTFASDTEAQVIATRFNEGHITDFSITADPLESIFVQRGQSYTTSRGEVIEGPAEIFTAWEPHNASICTTGADVNSSVRRSYTDLETKVARMDEALLGQLKTMGLPDGMTDPNQVLAWVCGKMGSASTGEATEVEPVDPIENAVTEPPPPVTPAEGEPKKEDEMTIEKMAEEVQRALEHDKKRRKTIQDDCKLQKLERSFADELCDDDKVTVEIARERILRKIANQPSGTTVEGDHFRVTASEDDKFLAAARDGLILRSMRFSGAKKQAFADGVKPAAGAEDFQNQKLLGLATKCLVRRGINVDRMTNKDIALVAMGHPQVMQRLRIEREAAYHTTGSFANLMLDAANKTLRTGYEEQEITGTMWARQGASAADLKDMNRIMYSEYPNMVMIPENDNYPEGKMSDMKEKYRVEKFGSMFTVSWETIVNDDLDAISKTPVFQGKAARRTLNAKIYEVLTANANMSDGYALFSASHASGSNLEATGGAPTVARLSAGFLAMASQKGVNTTVALNITPRYVLAPWALSAGIDEILGSTSRPEAGGSAAGNANTHNIYGPMGARTLLPIYDFCLDSNSAAIWYMASDSVDTVEYTFLEGEESPVIETEWNFDNDTLKHKIRQTFGCKAIDWRGLYENDGA